MSSSNSNQLSVTFEAPSLPILISRIQSFIDTLMIDCAALKANEPTPAPSIPEPTQLELPLDAPKKRTRKTKAQVEYEKLAEKSADEGQPDSKYGVFDEPTEPLESEKASGGQSTPTATLATHSDTDVVGAGAVETELKKEVAKEFTKQDATHALLKVSAEKGMAAAVAVLSAFNASKIGELDVGQYGAFIESCKKACV